MGIKIFNDFWIFRIRGRYFKIKIKFWFRIYRNIKILGKFKRINFVFKQIKNQIKYKVILEFMILGQCRVYRQQMLLDCGICLVFIFCSFGLEILLDINFMYFFVCFFFLKEWFVFKITLLLFWLEYLLYFLKWLEFRLSLGFEFVFFILSEI